jgi:23S rRNA (pseudouridine1915-N3)-methyltransferase
MRLCVVAIGQRMPGWVDQAWQEYARRFPRHLPLELREVPAVRRFRHSAIDTVRERESEALMGAAGAAGRVVTLDESGRQWSTLELSRQLASWMQEGADVNFLVGGPDGLTRECIRRADFHWSLGRLTLPHPMVRLVLAEQLYRAWTITQNHPYHRA